MINKRMINNSELNAKDLWEKAMQLPSGVFDGRNPRFGHKYIRYIEYIQGCGFESPGPWVRRMTLKNFSDKIRSLYTLNGLQWEA